MLFKKIVCAAVILFTSIFLCSCNRQVFDFQLEYTKVHVFETSRCYEITKWKDYEDGDQIQVEIKDYGFCLFHANQIVLIKDKCPFCD